LVIIDVFILTVIAVVLEVKASIWWWLVIIILLFAERHFSCLLFLDGLFAFGEKVLERIDGHYLLKATYSNNLYLYICL
jgi:hypothetical protein